jgi:hypothetical protein
MSAPHEHTSGQIPTGRLHRLVQHSQSLMATARQRQCRSEGGLHVELTLGATRCPGLPQAPPELSDRSWEVSVLA